MEQLVARHDPHTIQQIESCDGSEHAMHHKVTGLVLYYCNCGYSSGWVPADTVVSPAAFIAEHPPYYRVQEGR